MTKKEEAIARLKGLQGKLLAGNLAPDQLQAALREFSEGVVSVLATEQPAAAVGRKMRFGGAGRSAQPIGDMAHQESEFIGALPRDVQIGIDSAMIAATLLRKPVQETKSWDKLVNGSDELKKALDTATSGEGADWVPTIFSPRLIEEVTVACGIEQLIQHITMPSNPYVVPLQLGRLTVYKVSEQTGDSGQTAGTKSSGANLTDKLTLTAAGIQGEVLASKNLQEDSIISIMPFLRSEIVKALARGIEEACINGDTTATHMDSDTEAAGSDDRRTLWKGFRKHALEQSYKVDFQAAGNGLDIETVRKVRAKLGKYGVIPSELAYMTGLLIYFKMLSLKDSGGHPIVTTLDKMGANATIVTGQLGSLDGAPLLVSEFMREDMNASGVYDGSTTNLGSILCVHRPGWVFGDRRDTTMQVLSELYAEYQQDALLLTMRKAFSPVRAIASNPAVAIGYNIVTA